MAALTTLQIGKARGLNLHLKDKNHHHIVQIRNQFEQISYETITHCKIKPQAHSRRGKSEKSQKTRLTGSVKCPQVPNV